MRAGFVAVALVLTAPFAGFQQATGQDYGRIASDILHLRQPGDTTNLSRGDAVTGLKEALRVAAELSAKRLGVKDGFMADVKARIPLPGALGEAQKRLQPFGMAGPLDDLQLKVNRAAESAVPTARKLVVDAVAGMTIDDALGVLRGGDTAATAFLRAKTEAGLRQAFRPYFDEALAKSGAIAALDGAVARYAPVLLRTDTKAWLADNATTGALNGLFYYVAQEERAIRRDPVKRTSDILRRVFGG